MSWYFPVFLSVPVSLDFCHVFPYELSNRTRSFNLLFLTLGEFQAWDWLCMVFTYLWYQKRSRCAHETEMLIQMSALAGILTSDLWLRGHLFMTSKKIRFLTPPAHMGLTPLPFVDVHTRST